MDRDSRIGTPRVRARAIDLGKRDPLLSYDEMLRVLRREFPEACELTWQYLSAMLSMGRAAGHDIPLRPGARGGGRVLRTLDRGVHLYLSHEAVVYYKRRVGRRPQSGMAKILETVARDDLLAAVLDEAS